MRPFNRLTRLTEDDNNASICSWAAVKDNNHLDLVVVVVDIVDAVVVDIVIFVAKSSWSGCAQTLFTITSIHSHASSEPLQRLTIFSNVASYNHWKLVHTHPFHVFCLGLYS